MAIVRLGVTFPKQINLDTGNDTVELAVFPTAGLTAPIAAIKPNQTSRRGLPLPRRGRFFAPAPRPVLAIDASSPARFTGLTDVSGNFTTGTFNTPANCLLIVTVGMSGPASGTISLSLSNNGSATAWSTIGEANQGVTGSKGLAGAYYTYLGAARTGMTITLAANSAHLYTAVKVYCVTGASSSAPISNRVISGSSGSPVATTGFSTSAANELGFVSALDATDAGSVSSTDTNFDSFENIFDVSGGSGWKYLGSVGSTTTFNLTGGSTAAWNYVAFEVRPATDAPPVPVVQRRAVRGLPPRRGLVTQIPVPVQQPAVVPWTPGFTDQAGARPRAALVARRGRFTASPTVLAQPPQFIDQTGPRPRPAVVARRGRFQPVPQVTAQLPAFIDQAGVRPRWLATSRRQPALVVPAQVGPGEGSLAPTVRRPAGSRPRWTPLIRRGRYFIPPTYGKTYYVSAVGSDSNDGLTPSTPWQTINKVVSSGFNPGDTILFRGGDSFAGFLWITSSRAGTAALPVTYGSYGTGRATLTNTSTGIFLDATAGVILQNLILTGGGSNSSDGINCYKSTSGRVSGLTIDNCDVSGYYHGISVGGASGGGFDSVTITNCDTHANKSDGLIFYGSTFVPASPTYAHSNVTVSNCRSYSNTGDATVTTTSTGSGIILGSVDGGTVSLCAAHDNGASCPSATGPVGIWTYDSNNVTIRNCVSYNNSTGTGNADGDGFDLDIDCTNCTIEYCLAYGNFGSGILVFGSSSNTSHSNNVVRYNLCWGNVRSSVVYHAEIKVAGNVSNCGIFNNTLVAKDNTAATMPAPISIQDTGAGGVTARNNIFYQLGAGAVVSTPAALTSSNVLFQGNDYYRSAGLSISWNSIIYTSLAAWRAAVANQEVVSGNNTGYTVDPQLVNPSTSPTVTDPNSTSGANGLKLQSGSPIIGRGLDLPSLFSVSIGAADYFGNTLSSPYSIGAHQQTLLAVPPAILDQSSWRPRWAPLPRRGQIFAVPVPLAAPPLAVFTPGFIDQAGARPRAALVTRRGRFTAAPVVAVAQPPAFIDQAGARPRWLTVRRRQPALGVLPQIGPGEAYPAPTMRRTAVRVGFVPRRGKFSPLSLTAPFVAPSVAHLSGYRPKWTPSIRRGQFLVVPPPQVGPGEGVLVGAVRRVATRPALPSRRGVFQALPARLVPTPSLLHIAGVRPRFSVGHRGQFFAVPAPALGYAPIAPALVSPARRYVGIPARRGIALRVLPSLGYAPVVPAKVVPARRYVGLSVKRGAFQVLSQVLSPVPQLVRRARPAGVAVRRGAVRARPWFEPPGPQALVPPFIHQLGSRPKWGPLPRRAQFSSALLVGLAPAAPPPPVGNVIRNRTRVALVRHGQFFALPQAVPSITATLGRRARAAVSVRRGTFLSLVPTPRITPWVPAPIRAHRALSLAVRRGSVQPVLTAVPVVLPPSKRTRIALWVRRGVFHAVPAVTQAPPRIIRPTMPRVSAVRRGRITTPLAAPAAPPRWYRCTRPTPGTRRGTFSSLPWTKPAGPGPLCPSITRATRRYAGLPFRRGRWIQGVVPPQVFYPEPVASQGNTAVLMAAASETTPAVMVSQATTVLSVLAENGTTSFGAVATDATTTPQVHANPS